MKIDAFKDEGIVEIYQQAAQDNIYKQRLNSPQLCWLNLTSDLKKATQEVLSCHEEHNNHTKANYHDAANPENKNNRRTGSCLQPEKLCAQKGKHVIKEKQEEKCRVPKDKRLNTVKN